MQTTIEKRTITLAAAQAVVSAAEAKARELGLAVAIAVVDENGSPKAFARMDGAPLLSVKIAEDKAYTAAAYGIPTHAWHDFIKDDAPLLTGIVHTPRLVVFGGGFPIDDGGTIGAIGVSGGHYSQDMAVAAAGLAILSE